MLFQSAAVLLTSFIVVVNLHGSTAPAGTLFVPAPHFATLNGRELTTGLPLAAGDTVATTNSGSGQINLSSGTAYLGHKTTVRITKSEVRLLHGYLAVTGHTVTREGTRAVIPDGDSDYEVIRLLSGRCYIHVGRGAVRLLGLERRITLPAGAAITYTLQQQPDRQANTDQQTAPAQSQAQPRSSQAPAETESTQQQAQGQQTSSSTTTIEQGQSTTTTSTSTEVIPPLEGAGARAAAAVPTTVAAVVVAAAAVTAGLVTYCLTEKPGASPWAPPATQ